MIILRVLYSCLIINCVKCGEPPITGEKQIPKINTTLEKNGSNTMFMKKPNAEFWPLSYNKRYLNSFADWLLYGNWSFNLTPSHKTRKVEYEGYDGWYNNLAREDSGAIDRPLLRRWPAAYEDGTYLPAGYDRPNPLKLSEELLSGEFGKIPTIGRNALFLFFGQQVVEEILDAQRPACPPEYINIPVPKNHTYRVEYPHHTEMPVLRTRYDMRSGSSPNNPRQQLNEITPYIDGGLFYGISKQWSDQLRTFANGSVDECGRLASSDDGLFPATNTDRLPMANPPPPFYHAHYIKNHETERVERFFKLGNPRGNENAFLLTFGIMWFRYHNYIASRLCHHHRTNWSSEKIYNEARKWVIATQQRIYVYEWLPVLLQEGLPEYEKYDASIDPQIDQFFQSAAFRFGHTLVVPGVYLRNYIREGCATKFNSWKHSAVRTCNIFWRPQEPLLNRTDNNKSLLDIDRLLMGMSVQLTEKEDHVIVEDLRGNVFGPLEFPRRDLMALNIQRGRDHGLPDFNSARRAFGLKPYKDFDSFKNVDDSTKKKLKKLYSSIDKIDVWIGGILETDNGPGELFKTIIKDQFRRIRDGDRFWFENKENGLFTDEEINRIHEIRIYDVLMAVTKMDADDIPKKPFYAPIKSNDNELIDKCHLKKTQRGEDFFYHLYQLNQNLLTEQCTKPGSYDYFENSELSFILSFSILGAFIIGVIGVMVVMIKQKEVEIATNGKKTDEWKRRTLRTGTEIKWPLFIATEWIGPKHTTRKVVIALKADIKQLAVWCFNDILLRAIDFSQETMQVEVYVVTDQPTSIIHTANNYDLVLKFESEYLRNNFLSELDRFTQTCMIQKNTINMNWSSASKVIITKDHRQKRLEMFFRVVFAQAFKISHSNTEILMVDDYVAKEVVDTELTLTEFADALSMTPKNEFVRRMFSLIDKNKNGFISFREFVDLIIIFADGTEEEKAKLLFDMYDIDGVGYLKLEDFHMMIKTFLETVGGHIDDKDIYKTINLMLKNAGIENKKNNLTFDDFKNMIGDEIKNLNAATLGIKGFEQQSKSKQSYLDYAKNEIENIYETKQEIESRFNHGTNIIDVKQEEVIELQSRIVEQNALIRFIEINSKEIFWFSLYTLILLAIFIERVYYYSCEREHSGLRRISGFGVPMTRGAASAMMFTFSSLLVTMCRNTLTSLRDTVLNSYFPFDSSVELHKYIAGLAGVFTVIHIIGHAFNFYHISTQTSDDLTCLFRNYFHSTHEIPKFHYWCWQTLTGITGIVLTIIFVIMYAFALPVVRRKLYHWFWYTHSLYPLFFIFLLLHGAGRLIQAPFSFYFLLGPVILFAVDCLISISRKKIEIPVLRAEILPSNVTMLEFRRPDNFNYKSGQWLRIACMELSKYEYHPFTITSAPNEDKLTVHIRSVGPWTKMIRSLYDSQLRPHSEWPKLYLDGPYGEGHQDWNTYDVAILIGGGIGVTPFASILKDIAYKASSVRTHCQKVYFIWVCRTQKQFEWLTDIIREVEKKDEKQFVSCHIFITQFYEKFDLRTILLYICERHYQRVSNKSLFTNLRAVTHFGRPVFEQFFKTVQVIHELSSRIGVFSCGPPSMTSGVESACSRINRQSEQKFEHHFKNF